MDCEKCGIVISPGQLPEVANFRIKLCPLHAAAGELLEALKGFFRYYEIDIGVLTPVLERARIAITEAEK